MEDQLEIIHPDATNIDIGSKKIQVDTGEGIAAEILFLPLHAPQYCGGYFGKKNCSGKPVPVFGEVTPNHCTP